MIYFLINNNYHLELDLRLAKQLDNYNLGLIQVPYSLDVLVKHPLFDKVLSIENKNFSSFTRFFLHPLERIQIKKRINAILKIDQNDILLVHTEIPSINQYLIQKFYDRGAKVFLLEDGTATICDNNLPVLKAGFKNKIRTLFLNYVCGLKYTSILNLGGQSLPRMQDSIFNGVIVNYGNEFKREIKLYHLNKEKENFDISFDKGAIFFSQPLYFWSLSEEDYINYIDKILSISDSFSPFYFKFHPSEKEYVKTSIEKIINLKYSKIIIIKEHIIAEKIIDKHPVKYALSFSSTSLLNLIRKGVTPVFLNNLFYQYYPSPDGLSFSDFLTSFNCYSPKTLSEIRPGFKALNKEFVNKKSYSISEILKF